jgi:hypothetical protein
MRMRSDESRLLGAACDTISAFFFLFVWLSPMAFGPEAVRVAFMIMLVEFLLFHATAVLGAQASRGAVGCLPLVGFGGAYLLFFVVTAVSYESLWPLGAYTWLLLAKLFSSTIVSRDRTQDQHWQNGIWVLSFIAWLGLALLTAVLPIPQLGMTPDAIEQVESFAISGSLAEYPQKLVVFGAAYFLLLAWVKFTGFNILDYFSKRQ